MVYIRVVLYLLTSQYSVIRNIFASDFLMKVIEISHDIAVIDFGE
jgi:hypothetical protein